MCSLQMQAEAGATMLDAPELVEGAVERFVTKQARRWAPVHAWQVSWDASDRRGPPLLSCGVSLGKLPETTTTAFTFLHVQHHVVHKRGPRYPTLSHEP